VKSSGGYDLYFCPALFCCRKHAKNARANAGADRGITQARKVELSRLSGMIGQIFDVKHLGGGHMVFKLLK
jgi:hypothetical protein